MRFGRLFLLGVVTLAGCHLIEPTDFACRMDGDCPAGYRCRRTGDEEVGKCSLPSDAGALEWPDAGWDSGAEDAGGQDAGSEDGGQGDAGLPDDGGLDAGADDAGPMVPQPDYESANWHLPPDSPADYTATVDTVTDNVTGLVWQRNVPAGSYHWQAAKTYCEELSLEEQTGWRLPTLIELESIGDFSINTSVDGGQAIAAIDATAFPNTPGTWFWTSSTYASATGAAWIVNFSSGRTGSGAISTGGARVRCVRSAQAPTIPGEQYTATTEVVKDGKTSLNWQRVASSPVYSWADAKAYCLGLRLDGRTGWRLPSIKELQSIIDTHAANPSIDARAFPGTTGGLSYWSSSINASNTSNAWLVYFGSGVTDSGAVGAGNYLRARCVHDDVDVADAGPQDAGPDDAGHSCSSRYDCRFGESCPSGQCVSVTTGETCVEDDQCGRGQICDDASSQCANGCSTTLDCAAGDTCLGADAGGFCCQGATEVENIGSDPSTVLIPGGTFTMGSEEMADGGLLFGDTTPLTDVTVAPFRLDRTEVTAGAYAAWCERQDGGDCVPNCAAWCTWGDAGLRNNPINYVTWAQARAYCESLPGGRLPTEAEWELAARGTEGRKYPWGNDEPDAAYANWQNMVSQTAPVGTHPLGRTPSGLDDMAGNVWEWVADTYGPYPGGSQCHWVRQFGEQHIMRGNGWSYAGVTFLEGAARNYSAESSFCRSDIGFRCAYDLIPEAGFCERGADGGVVDDGGVMVLLPGGTFSMGAQDLPDEQPFFVTVAPYWIDRTEVTVDAYASWCTALDGGCLPAAGDHCNWAVAGREHDPINCVDQAQAASYCAGRDGSRLPTEAEWEFAALGGRGQDFPWGDASPNETQTQWAADAGTAPVGTHPGDTSPFGIQDLAGNVAEWVTDRFRPYPASGPQCHWFQPAGTESVVRGGSWGTTDPSRLRGQIRLGGHPTERNPFLGFRCARSP